MLLMSYDGNSPMDGSAREGGFSVKLSHRLHVTRRDARTQCGHAFYHAFNPVRPLYLFEIQVALGMVSVDASSK